MTQVKKGYLEPQLAFDNIVEVQLPEAVFLMGATGFVSAFIVYEHFELGIVAYCLIRAREADHGERLGALLCSAAQFGDWRRIKAPARTERRRVSPSG
jgi:hypothetical protein